MCSVPPCSDIVTYIQGYDLCSEKYHFVILFSKLFVLVTTCVDLTERSSIDNGPRVILFPFLKERVIGPLKTLKVCLFCPSQSDLSFRCRSENLGVSGWKEEVERFFGVGDHESEVCSSPVRVKSYWFDDWPMKIEFFDESCFGGFWGRRTWIWGLFVSSPCKILLVDDWPMKNRVFQRFVQWRFLGSEDHESEVCSFLDRVESYWLMIDQKKIEFFDGPILLRFFVGNQGTLIWGLFPFKFHWSMINERKSII